MDSGTGRKLPEIARPGRGSRTAGRMETIRSLGRRGPPFRHELARNPRTLRGERSRGHEPYARYGRIGHRPVPNRQRRNMAVRSAPDRRDILRHGELSVLPGAGRRIRSAGIRIPALPSALQRSRMDRSGHRFGCPVRMAAPKGRTARRGIRHLHSARRMRLASRHGMDQHPVEKDRPDRHEFRILGQRKDGTGNGGADRRKRRESMDHRLRTQHEPSRGLVVRSPLSRRRAADPQPQRGADPAGRERHGIDGLRRSGHFAQEPAVEVLL